MFFVRRAYFTATTWSNAVFCSAKPLQGKHMKHNKSTGKTLRIPNLQILGCCSLVDILQDAALIGDVPVLVTDQGT
jgi:hypothetical protein